MEKLIYCTVPLWSKARGAITGEITPSTSLLWLMANLS
jgi:hypothetical protein